ncbi:MAG: TonB-dependent receptor, partial [Planctomycetota bacterium]
DEDDELDDLLDSDIETLAVAKVTTPDMNYEVTSVERTEKPIGKTPAAIFVITNEMIQRSGARTIQDVFRMVPGMHVGRISNRNWSIGVRGNATAETNDLLVQVDGRSIYVRAFGGTLWGAQDFVLEDIERIEIIRGPGGSVWGANAVRGIINIVTKSSAKTQGTFVEGVIGDELVHSETFRHGGQTDRGTYRIWGRGIQIDGGVFADGSNEVGSWGAYQTGIRTDFETTWFDNFTIDAAVGTFPYDLEFNQVTATTPFVAGAVNNTDVLTWHTNLTGERKLSDTESVKVRSSIYSVDADSAFQFKLRATELDIQHHLRFFDRHSVVWGSTYRHNRLDYVNNFQFSSRDGTLDLNEFGVFFQDTIRLRDNAEITVGSKLSYNDFSGFEFQPTGRLVWNPNDKLSVWTAVSRAVRTPNFFDDAVTVRLPPVSTVPFPVFPTVFGSQGTSAVDLLAVEFGIRGQPQEKIFWDISAYHFAFRDVVGLGAAGAPAPGEVAGTFEIPIPLVNLPGVAEVAGFETFGKYTVRDGWQLSGNYTFAHQFDDGFSFARNSIYLQSSHNLSPRSQLDLIWRYRDNFGTAPAYNTADVRFSWNPTPFVQLTVVGRDLLDESHAEDFDGVLSQFLATEIQRSLYGMIQIRY